MVSQVNFASSKEARTTKAYSKSFLTVDGAGFAAIRGDSRKLRWLAGSSASLGQSRPHMTMDHTAISHRLITDMRSIALVLKVTLRFVSILKQEFQSVARTKTMALCVTQKVNVIRFKI